MVINCSISVQLTAGFKIPLARGQQGILESVETKAVFLSNTEHHVVASFAGNTEQFIKICSVF